MPQDERAAASDEPFDPGVETGYLRRGTSERELPVDAGADPFDPGPEIGYDQKRAKRSAKERKERQRREREAKAVALSVAEQEEVEEHRDEAGHRHRLVRERQEELERERLERELSKRRARIERQREELDRRARLELEERRRITEERRRDAERQSEERRRAELERRAQIEAERESTATAERERRARERGEQRARWAREQATVRGRRKKRAGKREERGRTRAAREEAKRAAARRRRAKRQLALGRRRLASRAVGAPTPPTERPAVRRGGANRRRPPRRGQLAGPTAKAALALAAAMASGTFLGAGLGLPVPLITTDNNLPSNLAGALGISDSGTPAGLTKGPYFPVVLEAPADYGEAAAKFHANRGGRKHDGQDVFARPGTPLVAVRDGIVIDGGGGKSFYAFGGGNSLVIWSPIDQRSYVYLHMLKPALVGAGEIVHAGQVVGAVGCTGSCDGPHLHFEVRNGRVAYGAETKAVDPLPLLREWPQAPGE